MGFLQKIKDSEDTKRWGGRFESIVSILQSSVEQWSQLFTVAISTQLLDASLQVFEANKQIRRMALALSLPITF